MTQMIETIGAELVDSIEEAHTATHVIASDGKTKLRRTPKVSFSVSLAWLIPPSIAHILQSL